MTVESLTLHQRARGVDIFGRGNSSYCYVTNVGYEYHLIDASTSIDVYMHERRQRSLLNLHATVILVAIHSIEVRDM